MCCDNYTNDSPEVGECPDCGRPVDTLNAKHEAELKELRLDSGLRYIAYQQKSRQLESCEDALAERDEKHETGMTTFKQELITEVKKLKEIGSQWDDDYCQGVTVGINKTVDSLIEVIEKAMK